jgi:hypothetical protein
MLKYILLTFLSWAFFSAPLLSQQDKNEIHVVGIPSPLFQNNYEVNDSVDVVVRIQNKGPQTLRFDSISFKISIFYNEMDATYIDTTLASNKILKIDDIEDFTIIENFPLRFSSNYKLCAFVTGTSEFGPNNTKTTPTCSPFVVSVKDVKPKINKLSFKNGQLVLSLAQPINHGQIEILDVTGKVLYKDEKPLGRENLININSPGKGFYFVRISTSDKQSVHKFMVP